MVVCKYGVAQPNKNKLMFVPRGVQTRRRVKARELIHSASRHRARLVAHTNCLLIFIAHLCPSISLRLTWSLPLRDACLRAWAPAGTTLPEHIRHLQDTQGASSVPLVTEQWPAQQECNGQAQTGYEGLSCRLDGLGTKHSAFAFDIWLTFDF